MSIIFLSIYLSIDLSIYLSIYATRSEKKNEFPLAKSIFGAELPPDGNYIKTLLLKRRELQGY